MLDQAFKRLFLILFPLSLLGFALFLKYKIPRQQVQKQYENAEFFEAKCPFFLGVSFFPLKKRKLEINRAFSDFLSADYLLSEQDFVQKLGSLKKDLQKEKWPLEKTFFVFPIALTKDGEWIISKKTFILLPDGERKELSHLTYPEIETIFTGFKKTELKTPMKLKKVFHYLKAKAGFLFYLEGSDRPKIIKNLENLKGKIRGDLYFSSSNERLLREILALNSNWKVLHNFKALVRFQMMSLFGKSFENLPGRGVIIPSVFPPSTQILNRIKERKKLFFYEKDPPYDLNSRKWIENVQALISSQPDTALAIVRSKKTCLAGN